MDLIAERDPRSFDELVAELNQALSAEAIPGGIPDKLQAHLADNNPYLQFGTSDWVPDLLESTIDASGADFGDVQLFDLSRRALRIVAQHGFPNEFLRFFDTVAWDDDDCSCGVAMVKRSRIIVSDITTDALFQKNGSREVMLRAKVLSCQSTPLVDAIGNFIGMVSTHYDRPAGPSSRVWKGVDQVVGEYMTKLAGL